MMARAPAPQRHVDDWRPVVPPGAPVLNLPEAFRPIRHRGRPGGRSGFVRPEAGPEACFTWVQRVRQWTVAVDAGCTIRLVLFDSDGRAIATCDPPAPWDPRGARALAWCIGTARAALVTLRKRCTPPAATGDSEAWLRRRLDGLGKAG